MDDQEMTLREVFNSTVRPHYQATHTPQCKKCMLFHPWGDKTMHVHHIVPISDGGTNEESNLITLCRECHEEWHQYCEGVYEFEQWLKMVPSRYFAAAYLIPGKKALLPLLEKMWPYTREARMVTEPEKYKAYTEQHSAMWVDW